MYVTRYGPNIHGPAIAEEVMNITMTGGRIEHVTLQNAHTHMHVHTHIPVPR